MARLKISRIFAICLAASLISISSFAQDHKALIGKWTMVSETNGDPVNWVLVLKDDGGKLEAFLGPEGAQPAKDVSYEDGVLKFKAPYEGQDYDIQLKLSGDKLAGTWSGGGDSGKTSGTKS